MVYQQINKMVENRERPYGNPAVRYFTTRDSSTNLGTFDKYNKFSALFHFSGFLKSVSVVVLSLNDEYKKIPANLQVV